MDQAGVNCPPGPLCYRVAGQAGVSPLLNLKAERGRTSVDTTFSSDRLHESDMQRQPDRPDRIPQEAAGIWGVQRSETPLPEA